MIDPDATAAALAYALDIVPRGDRIDGRSGRRFRTGLDALTLADALRAAGIAPAPDVIARALDAVERHGARGLTRPGAVALGRMLRLTRIERSELRITGLEAMDETRRDRQARRRAEKLARDREAARTRRGAVPRSVYLAEAVTAARPWQAAGVSRATWYRWRSAGSETPHETGPSRTIDSSNVCDGPVSSAESHVSPWQAAGVSRATYFRRRARERARKDRPGAEAPAPPLPSVSPGYSGTPARCARHPENPSESSAGAVRADAGENLHTPCEKKNIEGEKTMAPKSPSILQTLLTIEPLTRLPRPVPTTIAMLRTLDGATRLPRPAPSVVGEARRLDAGSVFDFGRRIEAARPGLLSLVPLANQLDTARAAEWSRLQHTGR